MLKRVKAHAIWREPSTSVLALFFNIWRYLEDKNQKRMFKSYICPLLSFFTYPIGDGGFKGFNNVISSAKIAYLFDSAKGLAEKIAVERLQDCKAASCKWHWGLEGLGGGGRQERKRK